MFVARPSNVLWRDALRRVRYRQADGHDGAWPSKTYPGTTERGPPV